MKHAAVSQDRSIVRVLALLGALLVLAVVTWPVLTGAQEGPDSSGSADGAESATGTSEESGTDDAVLTATRTASQPDETSGGPGSETSAPSVGYIDSSLEVDPDGAFETVVEVANAPAGSDLAVQIYDRITTVEQLDASTSEVPANLLATFDTIPLAAENPPESQLSAFTISLYESGQSRPPGAGAWAYRLDEPGVYPVRVRLRGAEGEELDSFVVYLARTAGAETSGTDGSAAEGGRASATRVALLARVHEAPPVHDGDSTPTSIVDESLPADRVTAIDRLITELTDRADLPVGFAVTPDTARRMYDHITSRPTVERMRAALADDDRVLMSAPYVDLDLDDLVRQDLGGELDTQVLLGYHNLENTLGQAGNDTWLVDDPIGPASVDALATRSVAGLVLEPEVLANRHLSPVVVDGEESNLRALPVFDTGLTGAPHGSGRSEGDPNHLLAAHHAVGRLAALRDVEQRGAAVAVEVDPDVAPERLAAFLDLLVTTPGHLQLTTVDRILAETETETESDDGDIVVATLAPANPPGPPAGADDLRATRALVDSYRSVLTPESPNRSEFDLPLAISSASDRSEEERRADLEAIRSIIDARLGSIDVPERDRVTLGTRDATFPLPVTTDSDEPIRVRIQISASDRVELPRDDFEATLSGDRTVVQIPVRALASGDTVLIITLTTPDGEVVLAESRYTVRSTAVSGVGVVLTLGAGGFLAVWWGRHWRRTRKDRRGRAPEETARQDRDATSV